MDFKQLEYFITIVEEGSINKAASKLSIAQPPLSRQLKLLEDEVGVLLFTRDKNRLKLTNEGNAFYEKAIHILNYQRQMINDIKFLEQDEKRIRLGLVSSSSNFLLSSDFVNYSLLNTKVKFEFYESNTYNLLEMIDHELIDAAICRTPFSYEKYDYTFLNDEEMVLVSNKPLPPFILLNDIKNKPLIIYRRFEKIFNNAFSKYGAKPKYQYTLDDAKTVILFASEGLGLGIVPKSIAASFISLNIYTSPILEDGLNTKLVWINKKGKELSQTLIDIKESIKALKY